MASTNPGLVRWAAIVGTREAAHGRVVVEAETAEAAREKVERQGYFVIEVKRDKSNQMADSRVSSINFVNASGLRPQDSVFVGLSNFPSFDRNRAGKERTKMSFGFF